MASSTVLRMAVTEEEQQQIRAHVRSVVESAITQTPLDQGLSEEHDDFSLHAWNETAVREKIRNELPLVYPHVEQGIPIPSQPGEYIDLYLPEIKCLVTIQTCSKKDLETYRLSGHPADQVTQAGRLRDEQQNLGRPVESGVTVYIPRDSNDASDITAKIWYGPKGAEKEAHVYDFVHGLILATIIQQDARDRQVMPGPSNLSDPCDVCLARCIAHACGVPVPQGPEKFSLKAWNGTAVHQKFERDLPKIYPYAEQEITVTIGEISGLGVIKGHVDLYDGPQVSWWDFKTTDEKKLDIYQEVSVPQNHAGQVMMYGYGLRRSGREAKAANLVYIPRDSNKISAIWVASCSYRENIAVGLMNRAQQMTKRVLSQDFADLQSYGDCFVCHVQPFV